nr:hypothetical protein [Sphingomonas sp. Y57]
MVENRLVEITRIYDGSNGDATKALYAELTALGPVGIVATNLFRACKNSHRAKQYRGGVRGQGSYKSMAYDRKAWSIDNLASCLIQHSYVIGIRWGWGVDGKEAVHNAVLYVDLPTGQVSFHTAPRGKGPDYPGEWDGVRGASPGRICAFAAMLLEQVPA